MTFSSSVYTLKVSRELKYVFLLLCCLHAMMKREKTYLINVLKTIVGHVGTWPIEPIGHGS